MYGGSDVCSSDLFGISRGAAVDHVVGVGDVTSVAEGLRAVPCHASHGPMVHPLHASMVHAAALSTGALGEHLVGSGAGAVDPVLEYDDPFGVIAAGFRRDVDEPRGIYYAIEFPPSMGV